MYWLVYTNTEVGQHVLHVVQSEIRPGDVEVINHGFRNPEQALAVMSHYLQIDEAGFIRVKEFLVNTPMSFLDRIMLAYRITQFGVVILLTTAALSILTLILLLVHIL